MGKILLEPVPIDPAMSHTILVFIGGR